MQAVRPVGLVSDLCVAGGSEAQQGQENYPGRLETPGGWGI